MFQIEKIHRAESLSDAYQVLTNDPKSVVLGGCGYLRMGNKQISTAIDLSNLSLDFIRETDTHLELGAMTTFRQIETGSETDRFFNGILPVAVKDIIGVQLRNSVTIGGSVAGRFPFSDMLTALVSLNASVVLVETGEVPIANFLAGKSVRDVVEKIVIPKNIESAGYARFCQSKTDYAILNSAITKIDGKVKVVVGARPKVAAVAVNASAYLTENGFTPESIAEAGKLAAVELTFGDNFRGSEAYRKSLCPVLIKRAAKGFIDAD